MENKVRVNGMTFVPYLTAEEIQRQVKRIADDLRRDLELYIVRSYCHTCLKIKQLTLKCR